MTARSTLPAFSALSPATVEGLQRINQGVKQSSLDQTLVELVKLRVSQINGCAFCMGVHLAEAARLEMDRDRLLLLPVWHEASVFSERERAALAWAEAVTLIADAPVPDDLYEDARKHLSDGELADLTGAVVAINGFNRIALAFRFPARTH